MPFSDLPLRASRAIREILAIPGIPEIRAGFYRLIDRHAQAGETDLLGRASLNFTLALYDTDTDTLYYFEMDT